MMNLIQFSLTQKFPGIDIAGLTRVIEMSTNPTVATEIILGIYEPPTLLLAHPNTENKVNIELISYDEMEETVKYGYNRKNVVYTVIRKEDGEILHNDLTSYRVREYQDNEDYTVTSRFVVEEERQSSTYHLRGSHYGSDKMNWLLSDQSNLEVGK